MLQYNHHTANLHDLTFGELGNGVTEKLGLMEITGLIRVSVSYDDSNPSNGIGLEPFDFPSASAIWLLFFFAIVFTDQQSVLLIDE